VNGDNAHSLMLKNRSYLLNIVHLKSMTLALENNDKLTTVIERSLLFTFEHGFKNSTACSDYYYYYT
jgi:hypothetical protein